MKEKQERMQKLRFFAEEEGKNSFHPKLNQNVKNNKEKKKKSNLKDFRNCRK